MDSGKFLRRKKGALKSIFSPSEDGRYGRFDPSRYEEETMKSSASPSEDAHSYIRCLIAALGVVKLTPVLRMVLVKKIKREMKNFVISTITQVRRKEGKRIAAASSKEEGQTGLKRSLQLSLLGLHENVETAGLLGMGSKNSALLKEALQVCLHAPINLPGFAYGILTGTI